MHPFVVVVVAVLMAHTGWASPFGPMPSVVNEVDSAAPTNGCGWRRPVDASVIDAFRPPPDRYRAGNRGLEYGTAGGEAVTAVTDGQVTFVGPVGGRNYVVLTHADDRRSTYGPLESISTLRGQTHRQGDQIGLAAPGFHLTVRVGERYLDPAPLLDGACGRPRLISPARFGDVSDGPGDSDRSPLS